MGRSRNQFLCLPGGWSSRAWRLYRGHSSLHRISISAKALREWSGAVSLPELFETTKNSPQATDDSHQWTSRAKPSLRLRMSITREDACARTSTKTMCPLLLTVPSWTPSSPTTSQRGSMTNAVSLHDPRPRPHSGMRQASRSRRRQKTP